MNREDEIVTFESYYDPMLAHIVRTRLEANGIPCFITDENMAGANPLYNQAVGGVKLKVFKRDIEKCRTILSNDGDLHDQDHGEIDNDSNSYIVCPFCASTNVENIASGQDEGFMDSFITLVSPFQNPKNWHCNNCLQDFE